jgi:hypothetical protein
VSNWGAYALAAGVYVLRGVKPPTDLFDPDREREILEVMVREGPARGRRNRPSDRHCGRAAVGRLRQPLVLIREILEL